MDTDQPKRIFSGSDVVMLTAAQTIIKNAQDNQPELVASNPNWTVSYFNQLEKRINDDFTNILGIDPKSDQRDATQVVKDVMAQVLPILSGFIIFMPAAVKDKTKRAAILKSLGFDAYYKKASKKDQLSLIELLYAFKKNATPDVITAITASKDISTATVNSIIGFADTLKAANVKQETYKSSSAVITAEGINELNDLYTAVVIQFSKLAQKVYKDKKSPKAHLFSYTKIKNTISNKSKKSGGNTQNDPNPPATPQ